METAPLEEQRKSFGAKGTQTRKLPLTSVSPRADVLSDWGAVYSGHKGPQAYKAGRCGRDCCAAGRGVVEGWGGGRRECHGGAIPEEADWS